MKQMQLEISSVQRTKSKGLSILAAKTDILQELGNVIIYPSDVFAMNCKREWLNDPIIKRALREIDKKDIGDNEDTVEFLRKRYYITPRELSTGFKNLVLCNNIPKVHRLVYMGRNCYKFLREISLNHPVTMVMETYMYFGEDVFKDDEIYLINDGKYYDYNSLDVRLLDLDEEGVMN